MYLGSYKFVLNILNIKNLFFHELFKFLNKSIEKLLALEKSCSKEASLKVNPKTLYSWGFYIGPHTIQDLTLRAVHERLNPIFYDVRY